MGLPMGECVLTIPDDMMDMLRRGRESRLRQNAIRTCLRLLTDVFVSIGASLTEIADVCEGECARRRLEYEQRKLAERKRGRK